MYSKNFNKLRPLYKQSPGKSHCQCCGGEIKKGDYCLFGYIGSQASPRLCVDCCGDAYYYTKNLIIPNDPSLEEKIKDLKKKEKEKIRRKIRWFEKKRKEILQEEETVYFQDRVKSLLKEYPAERIIRFVLEQTRK